MIKDEKILRDIIEETIHQEVIREMNEMRVGYSKLNPIKIQ